MVTCGFLHGPRTDFGSLGGRQWMWGPGTGDHWGPLGPLEVQETIDPMDPLDDPLETHLASR